MAEAWFAARRGRVGWLALVLAGAGCGAPSASGNQSVDRLPTAPYGNVETLVRDLFIPGADSDGYVAPSKSELASFDALFSLIVARAFDAAAASASSLGYDLWHVPDGTSPDLVALVERPATLHGRGTYVIDTGSHSNRVIEVPHPLADAGTIEEGVQLFRQAGAGALLVAGTHRCAALASTLCVGAEATNACAGRLRSSDVAHSVDSVFHHAHEALLKEWPTSRAVSLHAHVDAAGQPDLMVSAGTRDDLADAVPVNQLRDQLRAAGFAVASCNSAADPTPRLCGESNVQGRASNGAADACLRDATTTGDRFLHIEQGAAVLAAPASVIAALSTTL
jgi:hypothetical protein